MYAAAGTGKDDPKRKRVLELRGCEDFGTSAQVLQEFFVIVVKKAARPQRPGCRQYGGVPIRLHRIATLAMTPDVQTKGFTTNTRPYRCPALRSSEESPERDSRSAVIERCNNEQNRLSLGM